MENASGILREFSLNITVGPDDIDELQHVSNLVYLRWIQDVAIAHSEAVGLPFSTYYAGGAVFVVRRHIIDYLRPALRGDTLTVRTWISSASAATCERETEIKHADGQVIAHGVTTWSYVDVKTGRPKRIGDDIRARFGDAPHKAYRSRV